MPSTIFSAVYAEDSLPLFQSPPENKRRNRVAGISRVTLLVVILTIICLTSFLKLVTNSRSGSHPKQSGNTTTPDSLEIRQHSGKQRIMLDNLDARPEFDDVDITSTMGLAPIIDAIHNVETAQKTHNNSGFPSGDAFI
jgi:hypothetical protein